MSDADYERLMLERRCAHCDADAPGCLYPGGDYLRALQRHRGVEALTLARKVEPFFWGDADIIRVRLCRGCAEELGMKEPPRDEGGEDEPRTSLQGRGRRRGAHKGRRLFEHQRGDKRKMRFGLPRSPLR